MLLPWPRLRIVNMLFTSLVFLFVSNQLAVSTGHIADWFVGKKTSKQAIELPSSVTAAQYVPLTSLPSEEKEEEDLAETMEQVPDRMDRLFSSLQFRCAALLGLIWISNLLYPNYYPSRGHLLPTH